MIREYGSGADLGELLPDSGPESYRLSMGFRKVFSQGVYEKVR